MHRTSWRLTLIASFTLGIGCHKDKDDKGPTTSQQSVVDHYAHLVHTNYVDALNQAQTFKESTDELVSSPSEATLSAAKDTWLAARLPYGQSEAFRFYDGPIDGEGGPEGQLNAWPMEEAFLDYVEGNAEAGIINKKDIALELAKLPAFNEGQDEAVASLVDFDVEKAVATGYHAAEFLLWGQDLSLTGPGNRSYKDFLTDTKASAPNGARRGEYLQLVSELIVQDLTGLVAEWAPEDPNNYRNRVFLGQETGQSLKAMFQSLAILAKGELATERIDAGLQTREQEDEHSCFSDNTHQDIWANAQGILNVYTGTYQDLKGPSLSDLVRAVDATLDQQIKDRLKSVTTTALSLPTSFDQVLANPEGEGYQMADQMVKDLIQVANDLTEAAALLGLGAISSELPE